MFHDFAKTVTTEIARVLARVSGEKVSMLVRTLIGARHIVVFGAGRVGLACKGFAMRLGHVGLSAFTPSDSTVPSVGKGDLLIAGSSSGETQTVYDVAALGKKNGAHVVVLTADPDSRLAKLADLVLVLKAPTKFGPTKGGRSVQPMATLFEQSLQVLFDIAVLILMKETRQTSAQLWVRHSNLD